MSSRRPIVGEVVRSYLPRSETFTYTQLRSLQDYAPIVLTWLRENPGDFGGLPVVEVTSPAGVARRAVRSLRARLSPAATTFEHRLLRATQAQGCELLHAHFGWMGVASLYAAQRAAVPLVTTFHARDIVIDREDLNRRYPDLFSRGALFTAVGPRMAKLLTARGAPRDRIRLVPLGIDLDAVRFAVPDRDRPLILLQVGRLVPKKGVSMSLRAFAAAHHDLGPSELWLVGDGPLRQALESLAVELGIPDRVRFLGGLDHAQTLELMRRAHIGLQPSLTGPDGDIEGTPTVLLEMQAVGLPIVASEHSDIPAIVAHPEELVAEGAVEPLVEAILRTAHCSGGEWEARCVAGRRFVEERHGLRAARVAIEAVYDEALAGNVCP